MLKIIAKRPTYLRDCMNCIRTHYQKVDKSHPHPHLKLVPLPKYGGESTVTLLTGDSLIGKQGASYVKSLCKNSKVPISFEHVATTRELNHEFLISVMRNGYAIHVDLNYDPESKAKALMMNNVLDLYASVIKMHSIQSFNCRFPNLDITIISKNNTGDFSKLEYEPVPGVVETQKNVDDETLTKFVRFAFEHSLTHCRKKISLVHKQDLCPIVDGHFLRIAHVVSKDYPDIEVEELRINKAIRQLIQKPQKYDVICTTERYGTALASICSAVCGGCSLFSACDIGDHHAVLKPLQTKLSVTNAKVLSPYGVCRACVDLLNMLGNHSCAHVMWNELLNTMLVRNVRTPEFGGTDSSDFVICDIINNLHCKFQMSR